MEQEKELPNGTAILMIGTAILLDCIQALTGLVPIIGQIIGWLVDAVALFGFWLWFKMHGISFSKKKRGLTLGIGALVELIPLINILPAWTLAVVRLVLTTKTKKLTPLAKRSIPGANRMLGA
jgi:hypothetical protein